jgi:molecular chaperone Hsp33
MEKVPGEGGIDPQLDAEAQEESWRTALALAGTLTREEMLDDALPPAQLLHRLFHAEGLAVDRARALAYGCRCSRARLSGVLSGFSTDDLDHMAEEGTITMTCEFCNIGFRFERAEVQGGGG